MAASLAATVHGDPLTVSDRLGQLIDRTGADELLVPGSTFDRAALHDSDVRLAELFASGAMAAPAGNRPAA